MAEVSSRSGKSLSLAEGQSFKGFWIESKHNQGEKKNSSVHTFISYCDQTVTTEDKTGKREDVFVKKGQRIAIWGSAILDELIGGLVPGEYGRVFYEGKRQGKLNPYRVYDIFKDADIKNLDMASYGSGDSDDSGDDSGDVEGKATRKPEVMQEKIKAPAAEAKKAEDLSDDDLPF